jgi:hypothetical protein
MSRFGTGTKRYSLYNVTGTPHALLQDTPYGGVIGGAVLNASCAGDPGKKPAVVLPLSRLTIA